MLTREPGYGHRPATSAPWSIAPANVITLRPLGTGESQFASVTREHHKPGTEFGLSRTGPWESGPGLAGGLADVFVFPGGGLNLTNLLLAAGGLYVAYELWRRYGRRRRRALAVRRLLES